MTIKRYGIDDGAYGYGNGWVAKHSSDGDFVYFDDHSAEVARLLALVPRWVPVGERKPDHYDNVRVRVADLKHAGQTFPAWAYHLNGHPSTRGWHIVGADSFGPEVPVVMWLDSPIPPLPGTEP